MTGAEAKRALGVGAGTLARKTETHRDPFEPAPKPKAVPFKCTICGADRPCWMAACHARAAQPAMASPDDVLSGPGITIWDLPDVKLTPVEPQLDILAITRDMCK